MKRLLKFQNFLLKITLHKKLLLRDNNILASSAKMAFLSLLILAPLSGLSQDIKNQLPVFRKLRANTKTLWLLKLIRSILNYNNRYIAMTVRPCGKQK